MNFRSWGGACLPLFHNIPLGDSLTVRSYSDIPDSGFLDIFGSHKKRVSAFGALKVWYSYWKKIEIIKNLLYSANIWTQFIKYTDLCVDLHRFRFVLEILRTPLIFIEVYQHIEYILRSQFNCEIYDKLRKKWNFIISKIGIIRSKFHMLS